MSTTVPAGAKSRPPKKDWTMLRVEKSTKQRLKGFAEKAAKERGFDWMTADSAIDLLLTIIDHLPDDTRLEE